MKKILFATTALVATAGVASAEVAITGFAEIGILGGDTYATEQFHTDIDVTFAMTGEADNGLSFGASVDLDENGAFGNTTQGGETYFIAYGNARLDMGDVDGAFDAALQDIGIGGSIADDHTTHAGYNGNAGMDGTYDGQVATFSYTFSGFTGYLSAEIDDTGTFDPVWGVGAKYSMDVSNATIGVGLGYQSGDQNNANVTALGSLIALDNFAFAELALIAPFTMTASEFTAGAIAAFSTAEKTDTWGISLNTTFNNGIQAIVNYSESNYADFSLTMGTIPAAVFTPTLNGFFAPGTVIGNQETETYMGLGLGYTMNALTVGFNYGVYDDWKGIQGVEAKGYGLAVNYDLGGGLEAQFGYGKSEVTADDAFGIAGADGSFDTDQYSLGLAMSF